MQSHLSEKLGRAIYASMFRDVVSCWGELYRIILSLETSPREFTDPDAIRWVGDIKEVLKGNEPEGLSDVDLLRLKTAIWELYNHLGRDDIKLFQKDR